MNTMLKTISDTSNCSNNLQSVNDRGILHENITEMGKLLQKMHICQAAYITLCYAEVCKKLPSSELQKKQTGKAVADEVNADEGDDDSVNLMNLHKYVIKNLMCMTKQLQSCHYALYEMQKSGTPLEQIMSLQQIKQCRDWLVDILYQKMFDELKKPLIDISEKISKKNLSQQQPVQQVMQWTNKTMEQAMKVVESLDRKDHVPHDRLKTYEQHVKKLEQANIDIIQKHSEIMVMEKPEGWDEDEMMRTYPFERSLENCTITMVHNLLGDVSEELQAWKNTWRCTLIKHDVLSDPKKIMDVAAQLQNNLNQLVLRITQIMPLSAMKFSSECLTNAFQEQKAIDSVSNYLTNAFRARAKIREQQDQAENSAENQARNDENDKFEFMLEKYLKKIFELEKWIISMTSPILTSFVDCKHSVALIKKKANVIKDTCINVMCFIPDILDHNLVPFSHLTIVQQQKYHELCNTLPPSLDIIKNEYRKLCYYLEDRKNKEQEMSTEDIEEIKGWRKESGTYLDIVNHINMLQGQLMCINKESAKESAEKMLSNKKMSDLLQKISHYEMKANHLMDYHINRLCVS